jgi:hypothetical protein
MQPVQKYGLCLSLLLALAGLMGTLFFAFRWLDARGELGTLHRASPVLTPSPPPATPAESGSGREAVDLWRAEALRLQAVLARQEAVSAVATGSSVMLPPDFRSNLTDALFIADTRQRWQALKRLGLLPTVDDFRRLAGRLGSDWRAINEMNQFLPAWLEADPRSAADWAAALPAGMKRDQAMMNIVNQWVGHDATAALQWLQTLPPGPMRDQAILQYVSVTANAKPQEAAGWVPQIGVATLRRNAIAAVASAWARQDPVRAGAWIETLPADARDEAWKAGLHQVLQSKPDLGIEWYERIQDEGFRQSMVPTVVSYLARTDAARAAAWLETMAAGRLRDMAVQRFVFQIAATQGALAIEWAESIDDPGMRNSALSQAAGRWALQDARAAAEWVESLPAGQQRDAIVHQFAIQLAATQPALAAEWAATVQDASLRQNTLTGVASQWLRKDRPAATRWLGTAPLPESSRQALLQSVSGN